MGAPPYPYPPHTPYLTRFPSPRPLPTQPDRPEIQEAWRHVPLPRVRHLAQSLDLADDRGTVGFGNVKRPHEAKLNATRSLDHPTSCEFL